MTDPNLWNQLLIWPILNVLIGLYKAFTIVALPGAFGFAIIALTLLIRTVLAPLTNAQMKSAKKMQDLKPRLDELNKKHKDNKVALQQAQLALYKEMGINPAAGCLPLLVQIPIFIALYNVFSGVLTSANTTDVVRDINKVLYHPVVQIESLNLDFFGINLAVKPNEWQVYGIWLLLIPVITGLLQYFQTKQMLPSASKQPAAQEDQMAAMQKQMGLIMPVMIGFFALSFPIGLALYWNAFTLFGIMQQSKINKKK